MSPRASELLHDEFCVTGMFDEPEFQRKEQVLSTSAKELQRNTKGKLRVPSLLVWWIPQQVCMWELGHREDGSLDMLS